MTFCQIGILVHCSWARPEIKNKNRCNSHACAYLDLNKRLFFHHLWCTWRIIPVSKWLVAPIYLRDLLTIVINNLLTRMILQVGIFVIQNFQPFSKYTQTLNVLSIYLHLGSFRGVNVWKNIPYIECLGLSVFFLASSWGDSHWHLGFPFWSVDPSFYMGVSKN